ncbi:MAG: EamA family transporter [Acidovorax sp. 17-64-282]|nr:MAG: EamA family transporter [Acidovorax sp. 17-64-282]
MQALWMVLAAFLFASMGVCVKIASAHFNAAELVCYRGLIGIVILWLLARSQRVTLVTRYPGMHAWRLVLTVLTGFVGVVMMLRPSLDQNQAFAGLIGLMSGMTAAFAYMQVVALSRLGEPESRTVFYFAVGSAVAGGLALLLTGTSAWPGWPALWLLPIGVLAAGGQLCMTRAYASAKTQRGTLVVANLQYSGIVFAAIYSVALFGDQIPPMGWVGMALIVGSGIVATVLRARAAPGTPAEEH